MYPAAASRVQSLADVVVEPEGLVQHDHAGPGAFADGREGEVVHGAINTFRVPGLTSCSSASRVRSSG